LWQHQGITDPMMEFPYPISEELFRVLMIRAISVEHTGEGVGPPPFDTKHPLPRDIRLPGCYWSPLFPF
jgi:hypothetical protein